MFLSNDEITTRLAAKSDSSVNNNLEKLTKSEDCLNIVATAIHSISDDSFKFHFTDYNSACNPNKKLSHYHHL